MSGRGAKLCQGPGRAVDGEVLQVQGRRGRKDCKQRDIAVPAFGYKNHVSTDRWYGFICGRNVTSAPIYDGAQLPPCWIFPSRSQP